MGVIEVIEPALLDEVGHGFEPGGFVGFIQVAQDFGGLLNHSHLLTSHDTQPFRNRQPDQPRIVAQREGVSYKILRNALFASLIHYRNEPYIKKALRNEVCATLVLDSYCAAVVDQPAPSPALKRL